MKYKALIKKGLQFNYEEFYFRFLLCITVIISLIPFFKVGITSGDDLEYYMTYLSGNFEQAAKSYAYGQGRFYFLFAKPVFCLPYIFDNFLLTKTIQYGLLLLSFVLFAFLIKKIFKSKWLALLSFLFLIIPLSVMPNYHLPILAYPLFFSLSLSLALISLLCLLHYFETLKTKYLVFSVLIYGIVLLFYEAYLVFLGFIIAFIFIRSWKTRGFRNSFKTASFYKEIIPFISIALCYVIAYFVFRYVIATPDGFYDGSSFAKNFSIQHFFQILFRYNNAVLPTNIYHMTQNVISENSLLAAGHQNNFLYILRHSNISVFANACIQAVLFVYIMNHMQKNVSWKKTGYAFIIAFLLMLSSHLLIAVADKYNTIYYFMNGYVTSFYSYFAVTLILVLIFYAILKLVDRIRWLKIFSMVGMVFLIFYVSIITGYTNDHLSRDWQRSQNRFTVMDELIKADALGVIPEGAVVYSPDLDETTSLLGEKITFQSFHWRHYIHVKSGKDLNICRNIDELKHNLENYPDAPLYRILKRENKKNNDMFFLFSAIDKTTIDMENETPFSYAKCLDNVSLHYYSPAKEYYVYFTTMHSDTLSGSSLIKPESVYIRSNNKHAKIVSAQLEAPGAFSESFNYSNGMPYITRDTVIK